MAVKSAGECSTFILDLLEAGVTVLNPVQGDDVLDALSLAGIAVPSDMEGQSLCSSVDGTGKDLRDAVFSEIYHGERDMDWLRRAEAPGTIRRMIRTEQ